MVYSTYKQQRILFYRERGASAYKIVQLLQEEGLKASKTGVLKFLRKYAITGSTTRRPGSGRPTKITPEIKQIVDEQMERDDETTAVQLQSLLVTQGHPLSLNTILRSRSELGWTFRGSAYCQMIRQANKEKRLTWARANLTSALSNAFQDVVWTDETTVQLETHRRFACRKLGRPPKLKPRPKHPVKVHVWAGISWNGPTPIVIFEGKMNADGYISILESSLVHFLHDVYPSHHRFMQDNDPKHTSRAAQGFFVDCGINWWHTPPESPDCNPIENLWHELKEFVRREVKPTKKQELIDGIETFWMTVDVAKCRKYISHLRKVVPRVIACEGCATGY